MYDKYVVSGAVTFWLKLCGPKFLSRPPGPDPSLGSQGRRVVDAAVLALWSGFPFVLSTASVMSYTLYTLEIKDTAGAA